MKEEPQKVVIEKVYRIKGSEDNMEREMGHKEPQR